MTPEEKQLFGTIGFFGALVVLGILLYYVMYNY